MRKCYKCEVEKEFSEFHKDKSQSMGLSYECKKCKSEIRKKKREENPEYYREQCRKSTKKNYITIRESQRQHKLENRDKILARRRELRETRKDEVNLREYERRKNDPNHLLKERIRQKKWRDKNKAKLTPKRNAHQLVMFAIKLGMMVRPKECSLCGSEKRIEGHHDDYNKPLEVRWFCQKCHIKFHWRKKYGNE